MKPRESLTSLPPSPTAERHSRAVKYSIAMSVRMICIICLIFAQGWWLLVFAVGAVVLPYFAVVLANVGSAGESGTVERPGSIVLARPAAATAPASPAPPEGGDPTADPR